MSGLWLAGLEVENEDNVPTSQILGLDRFGRERIRFGVDSGAGLTVIKPGVASDYPRTSRPGSKKMRDCGGHSVADLGDKCIALRDEHGLRYAKVTEAKVEKNLMAVCSLVATNHEVVFSPHGSYIKHLRTGVIKHMIPVAGGYDVEYSVEPYGAAPVAPPRG